MLNSLIHLTLTLLTTRRKALEFVAELLFPMQQIFTNVREILGPPSICHLNAVMQSLNQHLALCWLFHIMTTGF